MRLLTAALAFAVAIGAGATDSRTPPATGAQTMVVTEQRYASSAGLEVLREGGNAVDAAVAVAYALAVVDPCCGNVGGGGFMLVRMHGGTERFIDFRERAPLRATKTMYLDAHGNVEPGASTKGWRAVGVPGTVLGMETARREFGTMSRAALMAPAIDLARNGFIFSNGDRIAFEGSKREGDPGGPEFWRPNARAIFLPGGAFPEPGTRVRQLQLARTLELIARDGTGAFYRGAIARAIVDASDANGGILTMGDFETYRVEEAAPLHCRFGAYDVTAAPPPSSGGVTLCEILNVIAPYPLARWGWHATKSAHYIAEAERRAYADRNAYLGDPDFVSNPVSALLSAQHAARIRANILTDHATPSIDVKPGLSATSEGNHTTHYSIVDRWGNAVGVSYTLNAWFGAGVIAGTTGFFLNDEMDDFTAKPGVPNMYGLVQGGRNAIAAGKRPLSSMAPTIVTRNGKLVMVTGSPGGSRIITIVLETILNALVYKMDVQRAVNAPRTHMQWLPDEIQYEPNAFTSVTAASLRAMGYRLSSLPVWGSAQAIVVDPTTGVRYGGSDRRRPSGAALGY